MTNPDELNALADRCEREEASFVLDCKIERLCDPERAEQMCNPRLYTTSIDAAVSLIPEGAEWDLTTLYGVARVAVGLNLNEGPHYASHEGGLLPMAICAAALRARAALAGDESGSGR